MTVFYFFSQNSGIIKTVLSILVILSYSCCKSPEQSIQATGLQPPQTAYPDLEIKKKAQ
jgi:hypothetical protein